MLGTVTKCMKIPKDFVHNIDHCYKRDIHKTVNRTPGTTNKAIIMIYLLTKATRDVSFTVNFPLRAAFFTDFLCGKYRQGWL